MGRLTRIFEKDNQKYVCIDVCGKKCVEGYSECHDCEPFANVMKKLAEYENLEEQGGLLKLPCKVGDTVYRILDNIYEFEVTCIRLYEDKMLLDIENSDIGMGFSLDANRLTKNLFLTYEEAEKALEMEK